MLNDHSAVAASGFIGVVLVYFGIRGLWRTRKRK